MTTEFISVSILGSNCSVSRIGLLVWRMQKGTICCWLHAAYSCVIDTTYTHRPVVLNYRFCPRRGNNLETFLLIITGREGCATGSSRQRSRVLLSSLHCTGPPPRQTFIVLSFWFDPTKAIIQDTMLNIRCPNEGYRHFHFLKSHLFFKIHLTSYLTLKAIPRCPEPALLQPIV